MQNQVIESFLWHRGRFTGKVQNTLKALHAFGEILSSLNLLILFIAQKDPSPKFAEWIDLKFSISSFNWP